MTLDSSSSLLRRGKRALWAALAVAAAGWPSVAAATDLSGVFSYGAVNYEFIVCSTCNRPSDELFSDAAGGLGSHGPAIVDGAGFRVDGSGEVYARSMLVGPHALPALDAQADAYPGFGPHAGFSEPGAYFFSATASANAVQYFSYGGASPQTYSFRYLLHGDAVSLQDPLALGLSGSGGLSIHDGLNPDLELPYGQLVDVHQQFFDTATSPFLEPGSVSIEVMPGGGFYLLGFVAANAAMGTHGAVDAQLSVELNLGDPGMLVPTLPPVPEPATLWLWVIGVAGLLLRRRMA